MKKILTLLIILVTSIIYTNISDLPNINFSKIEYVSYSMHSFSDASNNHNRMPSNCVTVQLQVDYDFMGILSLDRPTSSNFNGNFSDEIRAHRKERKAETKQYHKGNNNKVLNLLEKTHYQDVYVSSYSPFIDVTYDIEYFKRHQDYILELFTKNDLFKSVTVLESYKDYESYMNDVTYLTDAYDVYNNRTRSGLGVTIGLLDTGIVDVDHPDLQNSVIEVRSHVLNFMRSKEHATHMAQIICGDYGMAPDALVLSAGVFGTTITAEVEWMLDNDVDIINMSFGNGSSLGTYDSLSAYVDYIMAQNYVLVVVSAGNYGESHGLIDNPGLAYNAITVSALNNSGFCALYSSTEVDSGPIKPTIGMYGTVDLYDAEDNQIQGTSPATALTTGMLSLVIEQYSSLVVNREQLYALMCANAIDPLAGDSYTPEENGFNNATGAGNFNYGNMIANYSQSGMTYSSGTVALNAAVYSKQIYLSAGQTLRFSMATIASSDGTVSGISYTDYDIMIRNPNGGIEAFANSVDSLIELGIYTAPYSGTYKVDIIQASDRIKNRDYIGYAYRIYN